MYKVICLDLDGTLLDDNKKISKFNLDVLESLNDRGMEIVIATGRGITKARGLTSDIGFPYTIIANNGAIAGYNYSDEILFCNPIDYDKYNSIYNTGIDINMIPYLHVYHKKKSLVIPNNETKISHLGSVNSIDEILFINEADEVLDKILSIVYIDKEDRINKLDRNVLELNLNLSSHTLSSVRSDAIMIEYLDFLAEKSIGISRYLKNKKVNWEQVISFGDENNDIDMIRKSGIGVCMKNGTESLKINSKYISSYDNNNSGVGKELIKIFGEIK